MVFRPLLVVGVVVAGCVTAYDKYQGEVTVLWIILTNAVQMPWTNMQDGTNSSGCQLVSREKKETLWILQSSV